MDLSAIATTAIATLTALLANGGEGIANGIGNDLWGLIKKPFTKDQNHNALLEKFKENPNDPVNKGVFGYQLQNFLKEHHEMARQLEELLSRPDMKEAVKQLNISHSRNSIVNSHLSAGKDINIGSNNLNFKN